MSPSPSASLPRTEFAGRLPAEVLTEIFHRLARSELCAVVRTNSFFHAVGHRLLYGSLTDLTPAKRSLKCLYTLSSSDRTPNVVKKLEISWKNSRITGNGYRLLQRALEHLPQLTSLSIELSFCDNRQTPSWIFSRTCTLGQLTEFTTSIPCDAALAQFLNAQPRLAELNLPGSRPRSSFIQALLPTALPILRSLRATHSGAPTLARICDGRPIEHASLSLFADDSFAALDSLCLSTRPITRLTIMSFEVTAMLDVLLQEVASRMPSLEGLHIVALIAEYTTDILRACAPLLRPFHALKYLTMMAPLSPSTDEEHAVATLWRASCPSLRTVILPQGRVWFVQDTGSGPVWVDPGPT